MDKVCGWHLYHATGKTQSITSPTHQHTRITHSVHRGGSQQRMSLTFPRHSVFSWSQQHFSNHSIQKPTHMDQYLHWDSNYFITAKNSVFRTLEFRANIVWSNQHNYNKKLITLRKPFLPVILHHGSLIVYLQNSITDTTSTTHKQPLVTNISQTTVYPTKKNISIVIPYTKGCGEKFKKTCNNLGIHVHLKGNNTILISWPPRIKTKMPKSGVIYWFKCPHSNYLEE